MSGRMTRAAFVELVEGDRAWLAKQPGSMALEKGHIDAILKDAAALEYDLRAERDRLRAALEREVMRPAMDRQLCTLCRREVTGGAAVALFKHAPSCVLDGPVPP